MQAGPDEDIVRRVEQEFQQVNALVRDAGNGSVPVQHLTELFAQLAAQFEAINGGVGNPGLSAQGYGASAGGDANQMIRLEAKRQPEPVRTWLVQIADDTQSIATSISVADTRAQLNAAWNSTVLPKCKMMLANRYPLDPSAVQEVTISDFGRFFGHGGHMDQFFQTYLSPLVDTSQRLWRWRSDRQPSLGISNEVLRQFQRATVIRDAFFQEGGQTPTVSFSLKPVYLDPQSSKFLLDLGGQSFAYRHGPARVSNARWPESSGRLQVRLVFERLDGRQSSMSKDGPWAWFRVLDQAQVQTVSADRFLTTFQVEGSTARYEIQAGSVINPFLLRELHEFQCPERF